MTANTDVRLLNKLLEFLKTQILSDPANAWFATELRKLLGATTQPVPAPSKEDSHKITKIEQYLGLDYELDDAEPVVDYDFVADEHLRRSLQAYCREMLRCQYGTRGHKVDFSEFCRYAVMQAEGLLNLYYSSIGTVQEVREHILRIKPKLSVSDKANTIGAIPFGPKLWAYQAEHRMATALTPINYIREIRNEQSHIGGDENDDAQFAAGYAAWLTSRGYALRESGEVDWKKLKTLSPEVQNYYNNVVKNSDDYKRYLKILWQRRQSYEEIHDALRALAKSVKKLLSNHQFSDRP